MQASQVKGLPASFSCSFIAPDDERILCDKQWYAVCYAMIWTHPDVQLKLYLLQGLHHRGLSPISRFAQCRQPSLG